MPDRLHDTPGDDLDIQVSDTRAPRTTYVDGPRLDARMPSPLLARRTPSQRALRTASSLIALLAVVVLVAVASDLHGSLADLLLGLAPTPTTVDPLPPGGDLFYLLPNPPGVVVLLDGRPLNPVPVPGVSPPLRLARGRHLLEWRPGPFPFQPQRCVISVPRGSDTTCPVDRANGLPVAVAPPGSLASLASVIDVRDTLGALPQAQYAALMAAIQAALASATSTAIVQPGEVYFFYGPGISGRIVTAAQPLQATLRLVLDGPSVPGGCVLTAGAIQPCRTPGQECSELCTLVAPPGFAAGGPGASGASWLAGAMVSSSWTYTRPDGTLLASGLGDFGFNVHLAVLRITWDGADWGVAPVIGHDPALPASDDLLCAAAREWLGQGPLHQDVAASSGPAHLAYVAATSPVDGCAVVVTTQGVPGAALFLQRFGALVAANPPAHNLWPKLPLADAAEQSLALHIAAPLLAPSS